LFSVSIGHPRPAAWRWGPAHLGSGELLGDVANQLGGHQSDGDGPFGEGHWEGEEQSGGSWSDGADRFGDGGSELESTDRLLR
jgi:hypothetical protein